MNSNILKITTYLGLFLLISGTSYFIFGNFLPVKAKITTSSMSAPTGVKLKTGFIQFSGPKTVACPINGELHTAEEQAIWATRRPLEVVIENHSEARPQSGLQNADIVYETVAEGGITRFMGVFYCNAVAGSPNKYDVGPVRSARTYFLDLASEYADYPLYAHVGGANCSGGDSANAKSVSCTTDKRAQALEQISMYGWTNQGTWGDLNQFSLSYQACRREPERTGVEVATEHSMFCSTTELWKVAASRGLTNLTLAGKNSNVSWDKYFRSWTFKQAESPSSAPTTSISFNFWSGYKDYSVTWNYDSTANRYLRLNGGQKHLDFNTGEQLFTKNLVIQFAKETRAIDEHGHLLDFGTQTGVFIGQNHQIVKKVMFWIGPIIKPITPGFTTDD